ncbi:MAG: SUMF1/EgtB/PvdO family nonheme iron enzyme [Symploca sp. SIO3C6]|nr:SUMF1/EgtB/PvdO family nonheme iron enzyme [Symploca sp. SIO3C6]
MSWTIGHQLQSRPYVVEAILGRGGFGITYKARHLEDNQHFVIKTPLDYLKQDQKYGEYLRRFQKEGEKLKRLCKYPHPHIVQVIDFFTETENPCLVMEYIPGENLYEFVKRQGALTETPAVKVICQIGDALNFMHQAELVHRDATPLNMMMRTPEEAVLIDFGIAKGINPKTSTQTDMAGNRSFAPYEQVGKGSRQKTVDVYSLAASLYYAVTGECATGSLGRKMFDEELVPPSQLNPSISDRTNQAILKGMALEPQERPQSIQKWLNLLNITPTKGEYKTLELPLSTVEFETVIVDARGKVVKREPNQQAKFFIEYLGNDVSLEMVYIPGGKLLMGTEDQEIERLIQKFGWQRFNREKPQHEVTVKPFFIGKYPVTQAQWRAIASREDLKVERELKPNPANFRNSQDRDSRPVEQVSWYDAVEFCQRLSKQTGREYRLPSEAEWEYACRALTKTPFHFGETITDKLANYRASSTYASEPKGKYRGQTTPVGIFPPNAFGLYDMHGNVWEWCANNWHQHYEGAPHDGIAWAELDIAWAELDNDNNNYYQVLRGGSWISNPTDCRCAHRNNYDIRRDDIDLNIGFRVVCVDAKTT